MRFPIVVIFVVGLAIMAVGLAFSGCAPKTQSGSVSATVEGPVPKIQAAEVKKLLPDTVGQGKPVIVDFNSKFCLACQQLAPKLEQAVETTPQVALKTLDIQKATADEKKLMEAFNVTTVPYVAFINGEGEVKKVLLEDAEADLIQKATADLIQTE